MLMSVILSIGFAARAEAGSGADFRLLATTGPNGPHPNSLVELQTDPVAELALITNTPLMGPLDTSPNGELYGAYHDLYRVDLTNKTVTSIGTIHTATDSSVAVLGIAFAPDGTLYAVIGSSLYTVDTNTCLATEVGPVGLLKVFGIDFAPDGRLFGALSSLYQLNPATGQILTNLGSLGSLTADLDVAADGFLYRVTASTPTTDSKLLRINPDTGESVLVGTYESSLLGVASAPLSEPVKRLADALDATNVTWRTGGDADWFGQTNFCHDGLDAAQSGAITNGQTSWVETTVTGPGILSFWWKVSCRGWDGLEFAMDGNQIAGISYATDWTQNRLVVPAGSHTFRWSYSKGTYISSSSYLDAGWVDEVIFTQSTGPVFFEQPHSRTALWGESVSFDMVLSGEEPFSFQWCSNEMVLPGQASPTLTFDYTRTNLNASYSVIVSNSFGSVTSAPAALLVLNLETEWQRSVGGTDLDSPSKLEVASNGHFIIAGSSDSLIGGTKTTTNYGRSDFWLTVVDAAGQPLWDRDYGDMSTDSAYGFCVASNGDYVMAGQSYRPYMGILAGNRTSTNYGREDGWVVRVDAATNKIWDLDFGGTNYDYFRAVRSTSDGGFILCGCSDSPASGNKTSTNFGDYDFWIVRLAHDGAIQWDRCFGGTNDDYAFDVIQTSDGGYLVGGYSFSPASGSKTSTNFGGADVWLVRLDKDGNQLWDKSLGGSDRDTLASLQLLADGSCVFAASSSSVAGGNKTAPQIGSTDVWIVRLDASGNILWQQTFGGAAADSPREISLTGDGGYLVAGSSSSGFGEGKWSPNFGSGDGWLVRLNAAGEKLWDYSLGGDGYESLCGARETVDGGLIVASSSSSRPGGNKFSPQFGSGDFWLIKLGAPSLSPKFVEQPESLHANQGADAAFNVRLRGVPPLRCQWYHDGLAVLDGTNANLELSGLEEDDAGDYWLVVTNAYSPPATSQVATLTVEIPLSYALDAPSLPWSTGGYPSDVEMWFAQKTNSHDLVDAAQSGVLADNQTNWIQTSCSGPAVLSFWWKVSSQTNGDVLSFSLDGMVRKSISGEVNWAQEKFYLPYGSHVLRWTYAKNGSGARGLDAAWLDEVQVDPTLAGWPLPPEDHLVAWYPFNGNAADASGHGNDGLRIGATLTTDRTFAPDSAYSFDGANDYITCGSDASLRNLTNMTLAAWIRLTSSVGNYRPVLCKHTSDGAHNGMVEFLVQIQNNGNLNAFLGDGTTGWYPPPQLNGGVLQASRWYHLAMVVSNDHAFLYLDGNPVATGSFDPSRRPYGSEPFQIGRFNNGAALYFQGTIDEVRVYNTNLSPDQILAVMDADVTAPRLPAPQIIATNTGATLAINALACGAAPLHYEWFHDGLPISGANAAALTLTNVSLEDSGAYSVIVTNSLGSVTGVVAQLTVTVPAWVDDALETSNFVWSLTGAACWFAETTNTHDGVDALQSGFIAANEETAVRATLIGPGFLSFWWKVSSETNYDCLTFAVNGVQLGKISGETDWTQKSLPLPAGTNVIAWSYSKDYSFNRGADAGWLDEVQFISTSGPPIVILTPPTDQVAMHEDLAQFDVSALGADLFYQWQHNGTDIPGGTNASLKIQPVTEQDKGEYAVQVTSPFGSTNLTANLSLLPLQVQWQRNFGGSGSDVAFSVLQTSDGGYLIGGWSDSIDGDRTSTTYGNDDFWVMRLDAGGDLRWERSFGGSSLDTLHAVAQTEDGGFLLAGTSYSGADGNKTNVNFGGSDYWIVRTDSAGNKLWDRAYGGSDDDDLWRVQALPDGGFLLAGSSQSPADGNKTSPNFGLNDFWLVRVDANGDKLWDRCFGGTGSEALRALQLTDDGGCLLAGNSESEPSGTKTSPHFGGLDCWVVRVDTNGNQIWDSSFGGTARDFAIAAQPATDGQWLIAGLSYSPVGGNRTSPTFGMEDAWLVRLSTNGVKVWEQAFGGTADDNFCAISSTADGGLLLAGDSFSGVGGTKTRPSFGQNDLWLLCLDSGNQVLWDYSFGGADRDWPNTMLRTSDGGLILAGGSESDPAGNKTSTYFGWSDVWVIKLAPVLAPAPLSLSATWTNQNCRISLHDGETGRVYQLQRSDDIINWQDWQTVTNTGGVIHCLDASVSNQPYRFYRAMLIH